MSGESVWKVVVVTALLVCCGQMHAQTVQKCLTAAGRTYYDSDACAPGDRLLAVWHTPHYAEPPRPLHVVAPPRAPLRPRPRGKARSAALGTPTPSVSACQAAKDRRDAIERQVGLARTYELLSALNRDVYDACR